MAKIFDRKRLLDLIDNDVKNLITQHGGVLAAAYAKGLFKPKDSDVRHSGLIGNAFQNLVGPAYVGAGIPDFLHCELKTAQILNNGKPSNNVTIGAASELDFEKDFVDTHLYNKMKSLVVVFLERTGGQFKHPDYGLKGDPILGHDYNGIDDFRIRDVVSFDFSQTIIMKSFRDSFEKIKERYHERGYLINTMTEGNLQYDYNGQGNRQWRIDRTFAQSGIIAHGILDSNPSTFESTEY